MDLDFCKVLMEEDVARAVLLRPEYAYGIEHMSDELIEDVIKNMRELIAAEEGE